MSTSGVVGGTVFPTAKLLEHAIRRCGKSPSELTAETTQLARDNLFLLLLSLSSRGINLWCIDVQYITLNPGQIKYELPPGTIDVLNLLYSRPSLVDPSSTLPGVDSVEWTFLDNTDLRRVNLQVSVPGEYQLQSRQGGSDPWVTHSIFTLDGTPRWINLDPLIGNPQVRLLGSEPFTLTISKWANQVNDLPMAPYNRDDYSSLPDKGFQGTTVTNYYFEKLVNPCVSLWPVPGVTDDHLTLFRYRQVQDIGKLTNEVELPNRWIEAIIWQLALRLSYELPGVSDARIQMINAEAGNHLITADGNETDNAPVYFSPNISVYTR